MRLRVARAARRNAARSSTRSWRQPAPPPASLGSEEDLAVVQPVGPAVPERVGVRREPIAYPTDGTWDLLPLPVARELRKRGYEIASPAGGQIRVERQRRELRVARISPPVGVGFLTWHPRDAALHSHLLARSVPVKH